MEDIDTPESTEHDDNTFLCELCGDDHELLFLDSYLRETFRGYGAKHRAATAADPFSEEATI